MTEPGADQRARGMSEREVFVACHEPTGLGVAGACVKMVGTVADVWAAVRELERVAVLDAIEHEPATPAYWAAERRLCDIFGAEPES